MRLNVVNAVLPSELPPGPTRVRLTFVDGDGRTRFMLDALPAAQRQSAPAGQ